MDAAAAGVGSGAVPVAKSEAPTDERPPLGSELDVSELEEPMEDMPLIRLDYHQRAYENLGSKRV